MTSVKRKTWQPVTETKDTTSPFVVWLFFPFSQIFFSSNRSKTVYINGISQYSHSVLSLRREQEEEITQFLNSSSTFLEHILQPWLKRLTQWMKSYSCFNFHTLVHVSFSWRNSTHDVWLQRSDTSPREGILRQVHKFRKRSELIGS